MGEVVIIRPGGRHAAIVNELVSPLHKNAKFYVWDDGPTVHESLESLIRLQEDTRFSDDVNVHIYVCMGSARLRKLMVEKARTRFEKAVFPSVIHPLSYVSPSAKVGEGCFIGPFAVVNTYAKVKDFCIVNTSAIVEHDCVIEEYGTINPGVVVCGGVTVENGATIGANSCVRENKKIGASSVIGMQAGVVSDINSNKEGFWGGVPAKLQTPNRKKDVACLGVHFNKSEFQVFIPVEDTRDLGKLKNFIKKDTEQEEDIKSLHVAKEGRMIQLTQSFLQNTIIDSSEVY